ncbi:MAG TPA: hypothetical protein VKC34_15580 [Blastocatellia bacterium]|nr:hypothetical protein [Blastocatellia bacterium]
MVKRAKIAALILTAVFFGSYLPWQETGASAALEPEPQGDAERRFEIVGIGTPLKERPGKDDGASFVVHFVGDVHGSLEPCG